MKLRSRNTPFTCVACRRAVPPRAPSDLGPGGCRNHCPSCLASLHVDEQLPGDRASGCGGVMPAVAQRVKHGDRQLLQRCEVCGAAHWNVVAPDDDLAAVAALPAGA